MQIQQKCDCQNPQEKWVDCEVGVDSFFSCENPCGKSLSCGCKCSKICHDFSENCEVCDRSPEVVKTCPCGKKPLDIVRLSCTDPIPSCGQVCDKSLICGHSCGHICHEDPECPKCPLSTKVRKLNKKPKMCLEFVFIFRFVADVGLWIKKWNVPNSILARMTPDVISSVGKCGIAYVINVDKNVVFFLSILVLWPAEGFYPAAFTDVVSLVIVETAQLVPMSVSMSCLVTAEPKSFTHRYPAGSNPRPATTFAPVLILAIIWSCIIVIAKTSVHPVQHWLKNTVMENMNYAKMSLVILTVFLVEDLVENCWNVVNIIASSLVILEIAGMFVNSRVMK